MIGIIMKAHIRDIVRLGLNNIPYVMLDRWSINAVRRMGEDDGIRSICYPSLGKAV